MFTEGKVTACTQNTRGLSWERPLEITGPMTLFKTGQLEQAVQDQVHLGFEYPQEWRFHSLSEQPLILLDHLHRRKNSYVKTDFLVFLSVAVIFCPFTGVKLRAIQLCCLHFL